MVNNNKKLQAVQNATACVRTEAMKFDHIRPVLHVLHWLPVRKRIVYKLAVMVCKCLHGLVIRASRRRLRSAVFVCLAVTGTNTSLGTRNFVVAARYGTVCWFICKLARSYCRHLDRGSSGICLHAMSASEGFFLFSRYTNVLIIINIYIIKVFNMSDHHAIG